MTEAEIRSAINDEKVLISKLESQISDRDLKRLLTYASRHLDDILQLFLDSEILKEPRNPAQLERWLRGAETVLHLAIAERRRVEEIVAKFGPSAQLFG